MGCNKIIWRPILSGKSYKTPLDKTCKPLLVEIFTFEPQIEAKISFIQHHLGTEEWVPWRRRYSQQLGPKLKGIVVVYMCLPAQRQVAVVVHFVVEFVVVPRKYRHCCCAVAGLHHATARISFYFWKKSSNSRCWDRHRTSTTLLPQKILRPSPQNSNYPSTFVLRHAGH